MTTSTDVIEIVCSRCGERYCEWYQSSLAGPFSSSCPHCGHDQGTDLDFRENGAWLAESEDEARIR